MLWERLEILLLPRLVVSRRASKFRRRQRSIPVHADPVAHPVDRAAAGADWRAVLEVLAKVLAREARRGTRVHIALSDLWVRFEMMPAMPSGLSEDQMLLLARNNFARQYPETGQDRWTYRFAAQGARLLASALESELLAAIEATNASAGARLMRMEPLFGWVCDRFDNGLADATGWMLLDEPGMLSLAFVERGKLTRLHCQRCESDQDEVAVRLLERQSALHAQQSFEVRVFSVDARRLRLRAPWRIVRHQRVFDFDEPANLGPDLASAPAPAPTPMGRPH